MTPQEAKAKELVDKYIPHVYCFMGSGMLANSYDEKVVKLNAKACALIAVDEIISDYKVFNDKHKSFKVPLFWLSVKEAINKM